MRCDEMESRMSSKTFRVAVQSEPIAFTLKWLKDGKPHSCEFHCRPTVPLSLILEFADISIKDDAAEPSSAASGVAAMAMVERLYQSAIVPAEYPVFKSLLDDPDTGITVETYSEIAGWLAGEYTARPTGDNSGSSSPATPSGNALTAGVSDTELTYFRPEPTVATRS
jgi:hypothetical protein